MEEVFNIDTERYESSGLELLPDVEEFDCPKCGFKWRQTFIIGVTDV